MNEIVEPLKGSAASLPKRPPFGTTEAGKPNCWVFFARAHLKKSRAPFLSFFSQELFFFIGVLCSLPRSLENREFFRRFTRKINGTGGLGRGQGKPAGPCPSIMFLTPVGLPGALFFPTNLRAPTNFLFRKEKILKERKNLEESPVWWPAIIFQNPPRPEGPVSKRTGTKIGRAIYLSPTRSGQEPCLPTTTVGKIRTPYRPPRMRPGCPLTNRGEAFRKRGERVTFPKWNPFFRLVLFAVFQSSGRTGPRILTCRPSPGPRKGDRVVLGVPPALQIQEPRKL